MRDIPFTQYLMPRGERVAVSIEMPDEVADIADKIIARGFRFECEMLSDYSTVSFTITDEHADHAIRVVKNSPAVPPAIEEMIRDFAKAQRIAP